MTASSAVMAEFCLLVQQYANEQVTPSAISDCTDWMFIPQGVALFRRTALNEFAFWYGIGNFVRLCDQKGSHFDKCRRLRTSA